jgi:hypothetical protein
MPTSTSDKCVAAHIDPLADPGSDRQPNLTHATKVFVRQVAQRYELIFCNGESLMRLGRSRRCPPVEHLLVADRRWVRVNHLISPINDFLKGISSSAEPRGFRAMRRHRRRVGPPSRPCPSSHVIALRRTTPPVAPSGARCPRATPTPSTILRTLSRRGRACSCRMDN